MPYLLLILFPLSMAASCFVVRKQSRLTICVALAAVLTLAALVTLVPLEAPARLLGVTMLLSRLGRLFLLLFLLVVGLSFAASWSLPHGENFVPVGLLIISLTCAVLLLQDPFLVSLLLVGASLAAVLAVVDLPTGASTLVGTPVIASAVKYLVLTVIAGMLMYLGFVLADVAQPGVLPEGVPLARFVLALLTVGFALRLALVPFHGWLPDLFDDAAPLVAVLVAAVLNSTSLLVLILAFQNYPAILGDSGIALVVLRIGGVATALFGGLLALGQTALRRTLAYLLIYQAGMAFFGVASANTAGLTGALLEILNQAVAITLLCVSVGLLERPDGRTPGVVRRDLLRRWPVASVGLLVGALTLLGVPPFSGFTSKLLLYQSAAQHGWPYLLALLLASALACGALIRLARGWLIGPSDEAPEFEPTLLGETEIDRPAPRPLEPEPRVAAMITVLLLLICLGVGIYPQPLLTLVGEVVRNLTFINAV